MAWNRSLYEQRNGQKRTKCVTAGCPGDNREPAALRPGYEDCRPAAQYFGTVLLPYLGIAEELSGDMPTEQVKLVVRHLFEDFNYKVTGRNEMIRLEFESDSVKTEDLHREISKAFLTG